MKATAKRGPAGTEERVPVLAERRNLKMARSAHAYVRGNTLQFYEWLAAADRTLPQGPQIWICGDCHLGNLGPLADAGGNVDIQIRDLDQTVIGNPGHDLIRLALSLATAARGSDLPGVTTAHMVEQMIAGYLRALEDPAEENPVDEPMPNAVRAVITQSLERKWKHLARERIRDETPNIPLGKRFWSLTAEEKAGIGALFQEEATQSMVTGLLRRDAGDRVKLHDAAYWMKGCSSLGRLRFAALIGIKGSKGGEELCLVDIKEATVAAAPHARNAGMPADHAQRVVQGARQLSPHLGDRMLAAKLLRRPVVVRELMPQDLKLEIDRLTRDEATIAARFLAAVVGRAHARQMDSDTRRRWRSEVSRNHTKSLDAPSWLWSSVVELVAAHEAAYLHHCRKYALRQDAA